MLGLPTTTELRFGDPTDSFYFRSWGFVGYAQDDWRATPSFTMQYGIRYEAFTPPTELYGHISDLLVNSNLGQTSVVVPGAANPYGPGLPGSLVRGSYDNWGPRVGIAWRPPLGKFATKHATVIRADYSIFYNETIWGTLLGELSDENPGPIRRCARPPRSY